VRGGSLVSQVGPIAGGIPGPAIFSDGGMVRVTGGTLTSGSLDPAAEGDDPAVVALDSQLEITGGTFGDEVLTSDGRARIRGGTFEFLELVSSTLEGCSELRGGQVKGLGVIGGRLIVAGTGLALMPTAQPGVSRLTGTLEGGQPVNAEVVLDEGGQVQLVAPGSPGCP
jgi:hypothetical protein